MILSRKQLTPQSLARENNILHKLEAGILLLGPQILNLRIKKSIYENYSLCRHLLCYCYHAPSDFFRNLRFKLEKKIKQLV